jgi:hypothetical protein
MAHGAALQDCCDPGTLRDLEQPFPPASLRCHATAGAGIGGYLVGVIKEEISVIVERILARKDALDRVVIAAGAYGMVRINGIVPK